MPSRSHGAGHARIALRWYPSRRPSQTSSVSQVRSHLDDVGRAEPINPLDLMNRSFGSRAPSTGRSHTTMMRWFYDLNHPVENLHDCTTQPFGCPDFSSRPGSVRRDYRHQSTGATADCRAHRGPASRGPAGPGKNAWSALTSNCGPIRISFKGKCAPSVSSSRSFRRRVRPRDRSP